MSYITKAREGLEALESGKNREAANLLAAALVESNNPDWLVGHARALQNLNDPDLLPEALRDCDRAFHAVLNRQTGNTRKTMIDIQYRRAVILYRMGRFADADACAVWSQRAAEGRPFREEDTDVKAKVDQTTGEYYATVEEVDAEKCPMSKDKNDALSGQQPGQREWNRAAVWRHHALDAMHKLPQGDAGRKVTVLKVPELPAKEARLAPVKAQIGGSTSRVLVGASSSGGTAPQKLKIDFYQAADKITLTIFVKGTDSAKLDIQVTPQTVRLNNITRPDSNLSYLTLAMENEILPEVISRRVIPQKIELGLRKQDASKKWGSWGQIADGAEITSPCLTDGMAGAQFTSAAQGTEASTTTAASSTATASQPLASSSRPSYPSSARGGTKNWDTLKLDDDNDSNEADASKASGDPNDFFKLLYKNATPEQQRAMMKSFTESNGTALSTNWDEVSKGPVETKPPEGVEARKWGQ